MPVNAFKPPPLSGLSCCPFLGGGSVVVDSLLKVIPIVGFCGCSMFCVCYFVSILVCNHLYGEERAACFTLFVFPVFHVCCLSLPHDATSLSAVCDCGIS